MRLSQQSDRVCSQCGKGFQSGIAHLSRGAISALLCKACAKDYGLNWDWLNNLTNKKREQRIAAWKAKQNA